MAQYMFEAKVSNGVNDQIQNVAGMFGTGTGEAFESVECQSGTLCVQNGLLPLEGYEVYDKDNGNSWYFNLAPENGIVTGRTGDKTGIFAFNSYNVNRAVSANGSMWNRGLNTLGLPLPEGVRGDFTELIVGEQYKFGAHNFTNAYTQAYPYAVIGADGRWTFTDTIPTVGFAVYAVVEYESPVNVSSQFWGYGYALKIQRVGKPSQPSSSVIGFTGLTNSSGALTWTDSIADLQASAAYTTGTSGNYVSVTGALDDVFPFNALEEVTDSENNVFVKFPKLYMKFINDESGNIDGVQFSQSQAEGFFVPDCFLNPSDNTTYLDGVLIGKYEASGTSSKAFSKSGQACLVDVTRAQARTACRAYGVSGNAYNGYQQYDIQTMTLYNFLCMMYYRTANIQTVYAGRSSATNAASTGSTDGVMGMNGWNTSTNCVKMLGVENPYGNVNKWCDGVMFSSNFVYINNKPTTYDDTTTSGETIGFSRPTSSGYVSALRQGTTPSTQSAVYCSNANGGSTLYMGDYCAYNSGLCVLCVGGLWGDTSLVGLWYLNGFNSASNSNSAFGCRLLKKPL